jgi:hypothetical protein
MENGQQTEGDAPQLVRIDDAAVFACQRPARRDVGHALQ